MVGTLVGVCTVGYFGRGVYGRYIGRGVYSRVLW